MSQRSSQSETQMLAELYERPGFMLRRAGQANGGYFEEACAGLGVTTRQYDVLFVLNAAEMVDQDRLARLLGLDRSNAGLVVANLEKKGLLKRIVKPDDRRRRSLTITAAGRKIYRSALPHARRAAERLLEPLSEKERGQLFGLLKKIVFNTSSSGRAPLEPVEPDPTG